MQNSTDTYFHGRAANKSTQRVILFVLSLLIFLSQVIVIILELVGGLKQDAIILALGTLPILLSIGLVYRKYIHEAGTIIAVSLTILVTILATIGHGIYDIGTMAFPAILIIASLVLRKNTVIYLTGLILVCNGWLVLGATYSLYQPIYPQQTNGRQFVIASLILIITMGAVYILSNTVHNSLAAAEEELSQRKKVERALREAETMYRALVEQTSIVTYRDAPDIEGTSLYISPQIKQLIGYSQAEWLDNPGLWKDLLHPDDRDRVIREVERYITTGESIVSEYRMKTKDNRWIWVRDEAIVVKDHEGKPQFIHGVFTDITEHKTAEATIKQREAILGAVAATAQLLLKTRDWRTEINTILYMLGEATGASHVYIFENHMGSDQVMLSSQKYEWCAPGIKPDLGNPVYQNTRLIASPGLEDWVLNLSQGKPFYGSARQFPRYWKRVFEDRGLKTLLDVPIYVNTYWWGVIGFDDFVNEMPWSQAEIDALVAAAGNLGTAIARQQADKALRISEEKFQLAFHHTYAAMAISKMSDYTLLDINDAFCKVTGFSREEAIGKRAGRDLKIWAKQHERDAIYSLLEKQGYVDGFKSEFRRKDGDIRIGLLSAVNISIGGEACQLYSFYDISDTDRLMNELKAKNEELQSFTYTVSHDLKAPLVTISGFMSYLEQDASKGETKRLHQDVQRISDAITKMQRLLNELLELSRVGRLTNPSEEIPFGEIVHEALGLVEGRLQQRQVHVEVEADLPSVYGDRARLIEVIQNLVDNAAKFMGDQPKPTIQIGVKRNNDKYSFFVRDNGKGIVLDQFERIFGLFNKLDTTTEGTGIGLALVKRIIEVHGGKIWVESAGEGKGSTFHFTLAERPEAA